MPEGQQNGKQARKTKGRKKIRESIYESDQRLVAASCSDSEPDTQKERRKLDERKGEKQREGAGGNT